MKYCSICGGQNADGAAVCVSCGYGFGGALPEETGQAPDPARQSYFPEEAEHTQQLWEQDEPYPQPSDQAEWQGQWQPDDRQHQAGPAYPQPYPAAPAVKSGGKNLLLIAAGLVAALAVAALLLSLIGRPKGAPGEATGTGSGAGAASPPAAGQTQVQGNASPPSAATAQPSTPEPAEADPIEALPGGCEPTAPLAAPDELLRFLFVLEGDDLRLPLAAEKFLTYGWEILTGDSGLDDLSGKLAPGQSVLCIVSKNGRTAAVEVANLSDEVRPAPLGTICGVECDWFYDATIILPGNITTTTSTKEDVISVFGEPHEIEEYASSLELIYCVEENGRRDYDRRVNIAIDLTDGLVGRISLRNAESEQPSVQTPSPLPTAPSPTPQTAPSPQSPPPAQPPTITVIGDNPVTLQLFGPTPYFEHGVKAIDADGRDISEHVIISGLVNIGVEGTFTIVYSVTSPTTGLTASVTRDVVILAPGEISLPFN